jgi:dihydropteroate synthase
MIWRLPRHEIDLTSRGLIVGIVNVTPDSFSDGGAFLDPDAACTQGLKLLAEGADILDLGAESTRPGASPLSTEEELARLLPAIRGLRSQTDAPLSIDTSKASVAAAALEAGADIINDVTALSDQLMGPLVASHKAGLILMHMQGTPETMQVNPNYPQGDVVASVAKFLSERRARAIGCGVDANSIILDPGLGFGKTVEHNLALLQGIPQFCKLGSPLMIGHSRKSFLGGVVGTSNPSERLAAGLAVTSLSYAAGARLFRVHEARPHREALIMTEAIL